MHTSQCAHRFLITQLISQAGSSASRVVQCPWKVGSMEYAYGTRTSTDMTVLSYNGSNTFCKMADAPHNAHRSSQRAHHFPRAAHYSSRLFRFPCSAVPMGGRLNGVMQKLPVSKKTRSKHTLCIISSTSAMLTVPKLGY